MAPNTKLLHLEGLRGLAALAVLLAHLRGAFFLNFDDRLQSMVGPVPARPLLTLVDGTAAVYVFWVMSAFVLSLRFHRSANPDPTLLTQAALRRFPRLLLPVAASVLFAWSLHAGGLMSNLHLAEQLGPEYQGWLGTFYRFPPSLIDAANSAAWQAFFAFDLASTYNAVLWTMPAEFFGSLFLFAFLALAGKHPRRGLLYALAAGVLLGMKLHWLNAFLFGIALCDVYAHHGGSASRFPRAHRAWRHPLSGVVALLAGLVLAGPPPLKHFAPLFLATGVTALAVFHPSFRHVLSRRPLVWLGKISFGLYLIHLPIICAAARPAYNAARRVLSDHHAALAASAAVTVLSLAGGYALWWLADRPAPRLARLLVNRILRHPEPNPS